MRSHETLTFSTRPWAGSYDKLPPSVRPQNSRKNRGALIQWRRPVAKLVRPGAAEVNRTPLREFDLEASQRLGSIDGLVRVIAAPDRRGTILKYKADRAPIAYAVAVLILRVAIWALATPLICAISVIPLAVLGMFIAPINHHHQHVNSFRAPWLNRLYDLVLALQTGVGPYNWVLHHNLGHHVNYLNQPPHERPDESRWTRADGTQMGGLEYSIHLLLHHQIDIVRSGLTRPRRDAGPRA